MPKHCGSENQVDLAPLAREHFTELRHLLADPLVSDSLPAPPTSARKQAPADAALEHELQGQQLGTRRPFVILLKKRPVGLCGLSQQGRTVTEADVYYWLRRSHWRRGITSEAVRQLLPIAQQQTYLETLHSAVLVINPASKQVLQKNGFRITGQAVASAADYPRFVGQDVWHLRRAAESSP